MSKQYYDSNSHEDYNECRPTGMPRSCETRELIRNGSFEAFSTQPGVLFQDWTISLITPNTEIVSSNIAYEGDVSARFNTTGPLATKRASLSQNVTVTPGCRYQLSFAENVLSRGDAPDGTPAPTLVARVFYVRGGVEFDLISIPVPAPFSINANAGYAYHEQEAERSVPCDVSSVTVLFTFTAIDTGGTSWLLDGVSLRSVVPNQACS